MKSPFSRATVLALAIASAGCNRVKVDYEAMEVRMSDLEDKVRKQKSITTKLRDELEQEQKRFDKSLKEAVMSTSEINALRKSVADVQADFQKYRADYRTWIMQRGPGMKLGDLNAVGRTFHGVTLKAVNEWEMVFLHEGGVARLLLADASKELQDKFGYIPGAPKPAPKAMSAANAGALASLQQSPAELTAPSGGGSGGSGADLSGLPPGAFNAAPGTVTSDASGRKYMTLPDGSACEILGEIGGARPGGSSGGSSTQGYKSSVPAGYKKIGSNFTGSNLGQ